MRQTKNYGWDVVQRSDGRPDIEQVTNVFDSIDEKVKQLDDKDTFIENRIDQTNESVTQTNQKVTELTGTVTQTNNTVTQINTKVQGLETKTEQINTKITQIETEATSLGERVSQTETEITALDGRVTGLENATIEIATVEEAIAGERNDIAMSPYTTKQAHYAWGGGGRGNVFIRSKSTNSFTASTETTTFTISDFKDTYMIELIFKNLSLVEDVDYRLNRLTGEVTLLTFSLKTGDTIYYNIFDTKAQVFKSGQKQGEFVAKEETGTFTIPDFNNEKQATLIFDGLVLLENNEYTITNQGAVTLLNWTLKIGEKITYLIETTSYDYNELSNKPAIPTVDVDKAYVDNKVGDTTALQTMNKTSLVDAVNEVDNEIGVLSEKVEMMEDCTSGYIADYISIAVNKGVKRGYFMAVNVQDISEKSWGYDIEFRMGEAPRVIVFSTRSRTGETYIRELDTSTRAWSYDWQQLANTEQINVLEGKALQYKGVFGGDLNTLNTTESLGIYRLQATCTNTPDDSIKYVFEHAVLIVSTDGYSITQDLTLTHNAYSAYVNRRYFRTSITVTFQKWEQIATTSKTDILCTPKAGVTIVEQKSYMVNNVVYISIMFKKTDNSAINSIFSAINVPSFARPLMEISLSVVAVDAVGNGIVNKSISCSLNTSGDIWVVSDTESVATQIRVNGVFVL